MGRKRSQCGHEACVNRAVMVVEDDRFGYPVCPFHVASACAQVLSEYPDEVRKARCTVRALRADPVRMMGGFQWEGGAGVIEGWSL